MFFRLNSATIKGIDASVIEVEVDLKKGLPVQSIVGLPDPAVKEAKERVSAAVRNSGFEFPIGSLTVNLAPADLKKVGSAFDLAIALGILIVSKKVTVNTIDVESCIILGELSLDGCVRPIRGVLAILQKARESGIKNIILPLDNYREAHLFPGPALYPVQSLREAVQVITGSWEGNKLMDPVSAEPLFAKSNGRNHNNSKKGVFELDFSEVRGQNYAIRAVEIAAAGGHNILFIGSPGSGKTMIATRIPTILPELSEEESIETTKIYSIAGLLSQGQGLIKRRPFRAPHHTASEVSIIGGGRNAIPGEITLSHNGVLYLDEFTEFKSNIIQSLRQPLESGSITISRADSRLTFPAHFMLVTSMNPCPCGYLFDSERICRCNSQHINKYFMKISGPILDRIEIQVEVKSLKAFDIVEGKPSAPSQEIRERVLQARKLQRERLLRYGVLLNAEMNLELIKKYCALNNRVQELLYAAVKKYALTARSYYKLLKVARTIADLDGREEIVEEDVLEVLSYREVENLLYCKSKKDVKVL